MNCQDFPKICSRAGVNAYPTVKLYIGSADGSGQSAKGFAINSYSAEHIIDVVTVQMELKDDHVS